MNVYIIAVGGPSCAGKTELSKSVAQELNCSVLLLDNYYRDLSSLPPKKRARVNFDEPASLDHELLISQVESLSHGLVVQRPEYDFTTHTRKPHTERFRARKFLIVDGLCALYWPELRQLAGSRIFVDVPNRVCLQRRIIRDVAERGRSEESVIAQFQQTVQPMAELYVRPTSKYADLVLSGEQSLLRSADAVLNHVRSNRRQAAGRHTHGTQLLATQTKASSPFSYKQLSYKQR